MKVLGMRSAQLVLVALCLFVHITGCSGPEPESSVGEEETITAAQAAAQTASAEEEAVRKAEEDLRDAQRRLEEARKRAEQAAAERALQAERERAERARDEAEQAATEAAARAEEARKRAEEARKRADELAGVERTPATESCKKPAPSSNCGDRLAPGDERMCRLGNRSYTIRAGKSMDPCKPAALVVDLPSPSANARHVLGRETFCLGNICWRGLGSGWAQESDTPTGGFIVVVPDRAGVEDGSFLRQLTAEVKRIANVDAKKVFVSGIQEGGDVAFDVACRGDDTFHGVAPHSSSRACASAAKPISAISFGARGAVNYAQNLAATQRLAGLNGCAANPRTWKTFDASTRDPICRSAKADPFAQLVPCSSVRGDARIEATVCRIWEGCRNDTRVVFCDVAPNTEHGPISAVLDAQLVYSNNTLLNTPSVAWRFFQEFAR